MPSSEHTLLVFVVVLSLLGTASAPAQVDARAPPIPVCGVCSDALTEVAANHGIALERGETALSVTVLPDGTTRWEATVELTRGAEALRNASLRSAVVADAADIGVAEPVDVHSRLRGRTLTVSFSDPSAAETRFGVSVFTPLVSEGPARPLAMGGEGARYLGADSLTVRTPAPHSIYGDYRGASETERAVRWERRGEGRTYIESDPRVAVVPDGTLGSGIRVALARTLA